MPWLYGQIEEPENGRTPLLLVMLLSHDDRGHRGMPATGAVLRRIPRRVAYALLGAALGVGAPAGLLLVRFTSGGAGAFSWIGREIAGEPLTYAHVAVSTMIVFALFGWLLGRQADRLIELSITDALMGLLNARGFYQRLDQELARAPIATTSFSRDHRSRRLKSIHDSHGHEVGDSCVRRRRGEKVRVAAGDGHGGPDWRRRIHAARAKHDGSSRRHACRTDPEAGG